MMDGWIDWWTDGRMSGDLCEGIDRRKKEKKLIAFEYLLEITELNTNSMKSYYACELVTHISGFISCI